MLDNGKASTDVELDSLPVFVINARTDVLFSKPGATLADAVERGKAYLAAGATTVFVWGGPQGRGLHDEEIQTLVKEFNGMVNVLHSTAPGKLSITAIRDLGVARVSLGRFSYSEGLAAFERLADTVLV